MYGGSALERKGTPLRSQVLGGALVEQALRRLLLGMHCIDGHHTPRMAVACQVAEDRDLVGLTVGLELSQHHAHPCLLGRCHCKGIEGYLDRLALLLGDRVGLGSFAPPGDVGPEDGVRH